ncbi:hypothetical protein ACRE_005590 [Hapsidospora chrysogenum ATCC 11550]|uniref:Uncharacterized protein n=1 Tax=Hapsidospora chrysogenum (strain ATCC 11550 / CBS 779.69 / DSM 880 / IAM 14645 / JCM 23072 / IMI 49137) TaxID=857340 RepID=A0A086TG98_HAPC1|nr:hypothetical protein ACRE_005590 [Hapsidospora chrysogenum ATCC 11550]
MSSLPSQVWIALLRRYARRDRDEATDSVSRSLAKFKVDILSRLFVHGPNKKAMSVVETSLPEIPSFDSGHDHPRLQMAALGEKRQKPRLSRTYGTSSKGQLTSGPHADTDAPEDDCAPMHESPVLGSSHPSLARHPETNLIPQEQMVNKAKQIYEGPVMAKWNSITADIATMSGEACELRSSWARTLAARNGRVRDDCLGVLDDFLASVRRLLSVIRRLSRCLHSNSDYLESEASTRQSPRRVATRFSADGSFNGIPIEANADTGASFNVISGDLVASMDLSPEPGTQGHIALPSGRRVFSPGRVTGTFSFGGEGKAYELSCVILDKASHALVLGSKFLRLTETFTKYMHRLRRAIAPVSLRLPSLNLIGDEQEAIPGYLNGLRCLGVPDSGSDLMVVSGAYAKAHGLEVHRGRRHRHMVEFIDGSRELTDGLVRNLAWQFHGGEPPIRCDFHVIDNLPVDAILSNTIIDEYNVFSEYDNRLVRLESAGHKSGVYNIRLAEKCRDEIAHLDDSFVQDMTSDTPFTPEIIERERARRDVIRDRISGLLEHERPGQLEREILRQARFDQEWAKHRERAAAAGGRQTGPASTKWTAEGSSKITRMKGSPSGLPTRSGTSPQAGQGWKRWVRWNWTFQSRRVAA